MKKGIDLNYDNNPFKDKLNRHRTLSLFFEYRAKGIEPMFVLSDRDRVIDGVEYKSLKRLYLQERDIKEYTFATKYLDNWEQWNKLLSNKIIREHIDNWRNELELMIESESLQALYQTATLEGAKGTTAAKYLVEKGYAKKSEKKPVEASLKPSEQKDVLDTFLKRVK